MSYNNVLSDSRLLIFELVLGGLLLGVKHSQLYYILPVFKKSLLLSPNCDEFTSCTILESKLAAGFMEMIAAEACYGPIQLPSCLGS